MELALAISIIGCVLAVCNFVLARKDKSVKDNGNTSYRQGQIDEKLKNIFDKLEKIERHLDIYDKEIDDKIEVALEHHIKEWHKGE